MHMMIDLETFGTAPGSVIRSIGACIFDPWASNWANDSSPCFYANVDEQSCLDIGLTKDPRTEEWWAKQPREVEALLLTNQLPIERVLSSLEQFWHDTRAQFVWSYGANFDIVLIEEAIRRADAAHAADGKGPEGEAVASWEMAPPWSYKNTMCCRTTLRHAGIDLESYSKAQPGNRIKHHALDDARVQANAVTAAYQRLRIPRHI